MATLQDMLRGGYRPPTQSALADPIKEHFRTLPQQIEANQRAMDRTMAGMYETDFLGRPNPDYYPEAMQEFTQNYAPNFMGAIQNVGLAKALRSQNIGDLFDPRFDPRKLEKPKLEAMKPQIEVYNKHEVPKIHLPDYEGRKFITSMSDRTAAGGHLLGVDDVSFKRPIDLLGGQDYMFNNPGQVWASGKQPVNSLLKHANAIKDFTGENPLYMPWRMAPTGGDFAHMTGETMLAYAESAMPRGVKKELDAGIKTMIPDWAGVDSPQSVQQFRNAPDAVRKAIKQQMDVNFRDQGGMSIGQARLAVADPKQLNAQEGGLMNVGEIFADLPALSNSGHPSYPYGVQGQGLGKLDRDFNVFELLPDAVKERGILDPRNPSANDLRALQMKPYVGTIDAELLKRLGY